MEIFLSRLSDGDYDKKEVIFKVLVLANLRQNGDLTINDIFKDRNFIGR